MTAEECVCETDALCLAQHHKVLVCAACFTQACFAGDLFCDRYKTAGFTYITKRV